MLRVCPHASGPPTHLKIVDFIDSSYCVSHKRHYRTPPKVLGLGDSCRSSADPHSISYSFI